MKKIYCQVFVKIKKQMFQMKNISFSIKKKQIISEDIIYKNKNIEIKCIYAYNNKTNN